MKVKHTTLAERQIYKVQKNYEAKKKIFTSQLPLEELLEKEPILFIKEQNFNKAINPKLSHQAFMDSRAVIALDAVRRVYGRISVTKAVQKFFSSPRGQLMRLMQDISIDSMDDKEAFHDLNSKINAEKRQMVPEKKRKNWS